MQVLVHANVLCRTESIDAYDALTLVESAGKPTGKDTSPL